MSQLEKLTVSLTKNGYFKIHKIIESFPAADILSHIDGSYLNIKLDESQVINMLSIDPTTKMVPSIWDDVKTLGLPGIQALTFISVLFSHHKLIHFFSETTSSSMKGTISRTDLGGKQYTNFVYTMDETGLCQKKIGAEKIDYTLKPLYIDDLGPLVKELLLLKLNRIGWEPPKNKEFCRDFYTQCFYYNFHKVFGLSEEEFKTWLEQGIAQKVQSTQEKVNLSTIIPYTFTYKNILLKGVPGTGKSKAIDDIIEKKLKLVSAEEQNNILRINIHSASSNADLMQGIGITTENSQVAYKEKQGLIYEHIRKACYAPNQPFVLILEEIQENSLNELIGDLIYLIEPSKRTEISNLTTHLQDQERIDYLGENGLVNKYIKTAQEKNESIHSVKIPYLVETSTEYREMILPNNLYVFCTSNYRDDKKVIEDNLLRRFDVIELYPQYKEGYSDISKQIPQFLKELNTAIIKSFKDEIHPDRFQMGHANWLKIEERNETQFYKAFLKVVIDFKEIREIESKMLHEIFTEMLKVLPQENWVKVPFSNAIDAFKNPPLYANLITFLQEKIYSDEILNLTENY